MTEQILRAKDSIRVAIVDDHEAVRLGFKSLCDLNGFVLAGMASSVAALDTSDGCDVVVLDLSLADGSRPSENVSDLLERDVKVLVYSIADKRNQVGEALKAGASGLIRKSQSMAELAEAIQLVASNILVNNAESSTIIDSDEDFKRGANLSEREREVLTFYASGFTMKQVAAQMSIKPSTVKEHIDRVRQKYAAVGRLAPDKADLVLIAIEDGLIDAIQL